MGEGRGRGALLLEGRRLGRTTAGRKSPASLLFVTDPARTPDPVAVAEILPPGSAVIYRAFGHPGALAVARELAAVARRRRLLLLIGADEGLAVGCGAGGLHLPERGVHRAPRLRARHPRWVFTAAAHSGLALRRAAAAGVDGVLLSSVFASRSASDHVVLGPVRFARLTRLVETPVIALGGVTGGNAARLVAAGAAGLAAVDAWLD